MKAFILFALLLTTSAYAKTVSKKGAGIDTLNFSGNIAGGNDRGTVTLNITDTTRPVFIGVRSATGAPSGINCVSTGADTNLDYVVNRNAVTIARTAERFFCNTDAGGTNIRRPTPILIYIDESPPSGTVNYEVIFAYQLANRIACIDCQIYAYQPIN